MVMKFRNGSFEKTSYLETSKNFNETSMIFFRIVHVIPMWNFNQKTKQSRYWRAKPNTQAQFRAFAYEDFEQLTKASFGV